MAALAGATVKSRIPLLIVHGVTADVAGSLALTYHSCSPLPPRVEPFPLIGLYQKFVSQVPEIPFQRLRLLNSSSKVRCAVPARLFGSIDTMLLPRHE